MEWETEANLDFLRKDLSRQQEAGRLSAWDEYLFSNAQAAEELRRIRIAQNIALAQRSKAKLAELQQAEKNGVLCIKP